LSDSHIGFLILDSLIAFCILYSVLLPMLFPEYYTRYVNHVRGDVFDMLQQQVDECATLLTLEDEVAMHRYAPDKWSIKELLGHLCDTERVFAYRALMFARGSSNAIPGFEEDDFVRAAQFDRRTVYDIVSELHSVRASNVALFRSFSDEDLHKTGIANGHPISVHAIIYIIAGHALHHAAILHERYLV